MSDVKVGVLYYNVELRGAEQAQQQARQIKQNIEGGGGSSGFGSSSFVAGGGFSANGSRSGGVSGSPTFGGASFSTGGGGVARPGAGVGAPSTGAVPSGMLFGGGAVPGGSPQAITGGGNVTTLIPPGGPPPGDFVRGGGAGAGGFATGGAAFNLIPPGGPPRGGGGGGGGAPYSPPPGYSSVFGRRVILGALFGAREVYESYRDVRRTEEAAAMASSPVEELRIRAQGARQAFSGVFGSIIGLGMDVFGKGPQSVEDYANRQATLSESLEGRRRSAAMLGIDRFERGAGNPSAGLNSFNVKAARITGEERRRSYDFKTKIDDLNSHIGDLQNDKVEDTSVVVGRRQLPFVPFGDRRPDAFGNIDNSTTPKFEPIYGTKVREPEALAKAKADRDTLQTQLTGIREAANFDRQNNEYDRQIALSGFRAGRGNSARSFAAAMSGDPFQEAEASSENRMRTALASAGPNILSNPEALGAIEDRQRDRVLNERDDRRRRALLSSEATASLVVSFGMPRSAERQRLAGERHAALDGISDPGERERQEMRYWSRSREQEYGFALEDEFSRRSSSRSTAEFNLISQFKPQQAGFLDVANAYKAKIDAATARQADPTVVEGIKTEGQAALKAQMAELLKGVTAVQFGINQADTSGGQTGNESMADLVKALNDNTEAVRNYTAALQ